MPCTDGTPMPSFGPSGNSDACEISMLKSDFKELKTKLDGLTDMLCSLCKAIEVNHDFFGDTGDLNIPDKTLKWWKTHKVLDASKIRKEEKAKKLKETKEKALAKLTKKEKKVLGL